MSDIGAGAVGVGASGTTICSACCDSAASGSASPATSAIPRTFKLNQRFTELPFAASSPRLPTIKSLCARPLELLFTSRCRIRQITRCRLLQTACRRELASSLLYASQNSASTSTQLRNGESKNVASRANSQPTSTEILAAGSNSTLSPIALRTPLRRNPFSPVGHPAPRPACSFARRIPDQQRARSRRRRSGHDHTQGAGQPRQPLLHRQRP